MLEQLLDLLEFKREVMSQILLVSTLLAAMGMSGLIYLLADSTRGRLRSCLVVALTVATLLFLFGTTLDAIILPGMRWAAVVRHEGQIRGFVALSRVVVYSLLAGAVVLVGTLAGFGFLFSRRVGLWTAASAGVIVVLFGACAVYLDDVMRR